MPVEPEHGPPCRYLHRPPVEVDGVLRACGSGRNLKDEERQQRRKQRSRRASDGSAEGPIHDLLHSRYNHAGRPKVARPREKACSEEVPRAGFEPAAYPLGGDRSIQLRYRGGARIFAYLRIWCRSWREVRATRADRPGRISCMRAAEIVDMSGARVNVQNMSKMIQIRNVPDDTTRSPAVRPRVMATRSPYRSPTTT